MSIYVETRIAGPLEDLWAKTQTPELHERWDLRFTRITYLPRPSLDEPQRFLYETRIGFGLHIRGTGETVGRKVKETGERASALKFGSDDPKSLIREGSGYWKYEQQVNGTVRFFTEYRYETRYGGIGRLFNTLVFEPLMGWATAWSFDRLRLWIEKGIDPTLSLRQSLIHLIARGGLAFIFVYHGLVPKLLLHQPGEILPMERARIPHDLILPLLNAVGVGEIVFGLVFLLWWRIRWPFVIAGAGMIVALVGVALTVPESMGEPFNPVTLNLAVMGLSAIGYLSGYDLPSAARCLRQRPAKEGTHE